MARARAAPDRLSSGDGDEEAAGDVSVGEVMGEAACVLTRLETVWVRETLSGSLVSTAAESPFELSALVVQ